MTDSLSEWLAILGGAVVLCVVAVQLRGCNESDNRAKVEQIKICVQSGGFYQGGSFGTCTPLPVRQQPEAK